MTTLSKISEQVKRMLSGNPSYNIEISGTEIKLLVVQVINQLLRTERFTSQVQLWDNFPSGVYIATYHNIPVITYGQRSMSILPAYPLSLPKNMGLWQVSDENNPDRLFIPLLSGQWGIASPMDYLPSVSGIISYENEGLDIIYTSDLTKLYPNPVNNVRVKLLISDISSLTDYDLLPIPPEMEGQVIKSALSLIVAQPVYEHYDDGKDPRRTENIKKS